MSKERQKWTLREALVFLAGEEREEFLSLDEKWGYHQLVELWGVPPRPEDVERDRYWDLHNRLSSELLAALKQGTMKAEGIDPQADPARGPLPIHSRMWDVLDLDCLDSTASAPGRKFLAVRVWPADGARTLRAKAAKECEAWILARSQEEGPLPTKPEFLEEALRRAPGLSQRAFNQAWQRAASPEMRRPGAKKGRRTSSRTDSQSPQ